MNIFLQKKPTYLPSRRLGMIDNADMYILVHMCSSPLVDKLSLINNSIIIDLTYPQKSLILFHAHFIYMQMQSNTEIETHLPVQTLEYTKDTQGQMCVNTPIFSLTH